MQHYRVKFYLFETKHVKDIDLQAEDNFEAFTMAYDILTKQRLKICDKYPQPTHLETYARPYRQVTKAVASKSLLSQGKYPKCSVALCVDEWKTLNFKCTVLKESTDEICATDNPEMYDLLLMHPQTNEIFWGYLLDFDFKKEFVFLD